MKKICAKCGKELPIEDFPIRNKKKGTRISYCINCKREYDREYWEKTKHVRGVKKNNDAKLIKERNRNYIIDYLSHHPCVDCGETDIVVLEFDHQRDKSFNISDASRGGMSIEKIKTEIEKCEVVCANCHKRRTAKQFNYYKNDVGVRIQPS